MRTKKLKDLSIQFFKKVDVKKTNDAIMKKALDILAVKMTPRSP